MRKLWNVKMNAALRELGTTYSKFINALKVKNILLDRKILADLAENNPEVFKKIVEATK
jgi:large subunit ribosomal protein L20